jgi:hypothetical protein
MSICPLYTGQVKIMMKIITENKRRVHCI